MKKLYALAAAALAVLGMNAQNLYFVGAGDGLAWEPGTPLEVALTNNAYTVTIDNLTSFKMSTVKGSWDEFNAAGLGAEGIWDKANLGKPLALEHREDNQDVPWKGKYTIVVTGDLSTITITTTTPEPAEGDYTKVYMRGGMNNWGNDGMCNETWQFTTTDGIVYWFDCKGETMIPTGTEFKVADADWGAINYTAGDTVYPTGAPVIWLYNNSANSLMGMDYEGTIMLNLLNGPRKEAECTVFPTIVEHPGSSVAEIAVEEAAPEYFNLQGVRVAQPEAGLYIVRRGAKVEKIMVK